MEHNNNSQPQRSTLMKTFLFLEIGFLEIGFVVLLLGITFGLLNYFAIINLSKTIPSLSFLPQRTNKTATTSPTLPITPSSIHPTYSEAQVAIFDNPALTQQKVQERMQQLTKNANLILTELQNNQKYKIDNPKEYDATLHNLQTTNTALTKQAELMKGATDSESFLRILKNVETAHTNNTLIHTATSLTVIDGEKVLENLAHITIPLPAFLAQLKKEGMNTSIADKDLQILQTDEQKLEEILTAYKESAVEVVPTDPRVMSNFLLFQKNIPSLKTLLGKLQNDVSQIRIDTQKLVQ